MRPTSDSARRLVARWITHDLSLPVEIAVAVFLGLGWALYLFYVGASSDGDGPMYLTAAMAISNLDLSALAEGWPPLLPALFALARLVFVSPDAAATLVVAAGYGFALLLVALILRRCEVSAWLTILVLVFLATSHVYVIEFRFLHSEAPFTAFVLLHLWALQRHLELPRARRWLILAAVGAAAVAMTRYSGYPVLGLFVAYLAYRWAVERHDRGFLGALALLTLLPNVLWALRNLVTSGAIHGLRAPGNASLLASIWGLPDLLTAAIPGVAIWIVLFALVLPVATKWRELRSLRGLLAKPRWMLAGYLIALIAAYLVFLLYASTVVPLLPLKTNHRMIVPVVPVMLILAMLAVRLLADSRPRRSTLLLVVLVLAGSLAASGWWRWPYFVEKLAVSPFAEPYHLDAGFRLSHTRSVIASYLANELARTAAFEDTRDVLVTGIYDVGMRRRDNLYPSMLLFRRSIVESATLLSYDNVRIEGGAANGRGSEYDLTVQLRTGQHRLRYRSLAYGCCQGWATLLQDLLRIVDQEGMGSIVVFLDDQTYSRMGPRNVGHPQRQKPGPSNDEERRRESESSRVPSGERYATGDAFRRLKERFMASDSLEEWEAMQEEAWALEAMVPWWRNVSGRELSKIMQEYIDTRRSPAERAAAQSLPTDRGSPFVVREDRAIGPYHFMRWERNTATRPGAPR